MADPRDKGNLRPTPTITKPQTSSRPLSGIFGALPPAPVAAPGPTPMSGASNKDFAPKSAQISEVAIDGSGEQEQENKRSRLASDQMETDTRTFAPSPIPAAVPPGGGNMLQAPQTTLQLGPTQTVGFALRPTGLGRAQCDELSLFKRSAILGFSGEEHCRGDVVGPVTEFVAASKVLELQRGTVQNQQEAIASINAALTKSIEENAAAMKKIAGMYMDTANEVSDALRNIELLRKLLPAHLHHFLCILESRILQLHSLHTLFLDQLRSFGAGRPNDTPTPLLDRTTAKQATSTPQMSVRAAGGARPCCSTSTVGNCYRDRTPCWPKSRGGRYALSDVTESQFEDVSHVAGLRVRPHCCGLEQSACPLMQAVDHVLLMVCVSVSTCSLSLAGGVPGLLRLRRVSMLAERAPYRWFRSRRSLQREWRAIHGS